MSVTMQTYTVDTTPVLIVPPITQREADVYVSGNINSVWFGTSSSMVVQDDSIGWPVAAGEPLRLRRGDELWAAKDASPSVFVTVCVNEF